MVNYLQKYIKYKKKLQSLKGGANEKKEKEKEKDHSHLHGHPRLGQLQYLHDPTHKHGHQGDQGNSLAHNLMTMNPKSDLFHAGHHMKQFFGKATDPTSANNWALLQYVTSLSGKGKKQSGQKAIETMMLAELLGKELKDGTSNGAKNINDAYLYLAAMDGVFPSGKQSKRYQRHMQYQILRSMMNTQENIDPNDPNGQAKADIFANGLNTNLLQLQALTLFARNDGKTDPSFLQYYVNPIHKKYFTEHILKNTYNMSWNFPGLEPGKRNYLRKLLGQAKLLSAHVGNNKMNSDDEATVAFAGAFSAALIFPEYQLLKEPIMAKWFLGNDNWSRIHNHLHEYTMPNDLLLRPEGSERVKGFHMGYHMHSDDVEPIFTLDQLMEHNKEGHYHTKHYGVTDLGYVPVGHFQLNPDEESDWKYCDQWSYRQKRDANGKKIEGEFYTGDVESCDKDTKCKWDTKHSKCRDNWSYEQGVKYEENKTRFQASNKTIADLNKIISDANSTQEEKEAAKKRLDDFEIELAVAKRAVKGKAEGVKTMGVPAGKAAATIANQSKQMGIVRERAVVAAREAAAREAAQQATTETDQTPPSSPRSP